MDKEEFRVRLEEINHLVEKKDYKGAKDVADSIDWRRVKNVRTLSVVGEIYLANECYEDSREIFLLAYHRSSIGKNILARLIEVSLKLNDYDEAEEYFEEFCSVAPHDSTRWILNYKILRAKNAPIEEQIHVLEKYKDREFTEKWSYELAQLYFSAGEKQKCEELCNEMVLWFSEGSYVMKALNLKQRMGVMTASEKERYEKAMTPKLHTLEEVQENQDQEEELEDSEETKEETSEPQIDTITIRQDDIRGSETFQEKISKGIRDIFGARREKSAQDEEDDEDLSDEYSGAEFEEVPDLEAEEDLQNSPAAEAAEADSEAEKPTEQEESEEAEEQPISQKESFAKTMKMPELKIPWSMRRAAVEKKDEPVEEADEPEDEFEDDFEDAEEESVDQTEAEAESMDQTKESESVESEGQKEAEAAETNSGSEFSFNLEDAILAAASEQGIEIPGTEAGEPAEEEPAAEEPAAEESVVEELAAEENTTADETAEEDTIVEVPAAEVSMEPDFIEEDGSKEESPVEPEAVEELLTEEPVKEETPKAEIPKIEVPDLEEEDLFADFSEEAFAEELESEFEEAEEADTVPEETSEEVSEEEQPEEEDTVEKPIEDKTEDLEEETFEENLQEETDEEDDVPMLSMPGDEKNTESESEEEQLTEEEQLERFIDSLKPEKDPREIIPREKDLTDDEKKLFSYFVKVPGMKGQLVETLCRVQKESVDSTSKTGNVMIMGGTESGKTRLISGLIPAICKELHISASKVAYVFAEQINGKDLSIVKKKLSGGFFIIERANQLDPETAEKLNALMEQETEGMIVILEDDKIGMRKLIARYPKLAQKFTSVINIPVFTNDELAHFAKIYALEQGYRIDNMGMLALYNRIGNSQKADQPMNVGTVKGIVDAAISKSQGGINKLRRNSSKRLDRDGYHILLEKDFK